MNSVSALILSGTAAYFFGFLAGREGFTHSQGKALKLVSQGRDLGWCRPTWAGGQCGAVAGTEAPAFLPGRGGIRLTVERIEELGAVAPERVPSLSRASF